MSAGPEQPLHMAVVGGGTMGVGIAYVFAAAGFEVLVVEPDANRVDSLRRTLASVSAAGVQRGKLTAEQARRAAGVPIRATVADLPLGLDLVVETVPERRPLKCEVLAAIAARRPGVIGTNTSSLSIDELAQSVPDAGAFLGMHFFNPVWSLGLVELIEGRDTRPEVLEQARQWVGVIGKTPITVRNMPGFATSRLDLIASLEAMRMLQDGVASAEDIDRAAVLAYRHPVGPLRLSDMVGLDVRLDIARHLSHALGDRYAPPRILEELVAQGRLGQKSGRGFFDWPAAA